MIQNCLYVSIPFKRESVFKAVYEAWRASDEKVAEFQFPSNGKVYSKVGNLIVDAESYIDVSIPFKRESVFKGEKNPLRLRSFLTFQFPSNGKVYSKCNTCYVQRNHISVSIPFKRESVFKGALGEIKSDSDIGFNSLQTGKCIQSVEVETSAPINLESFNSLQTGKCIQRDPILPPSQAMALERQNQTRAARGFFYFKIYPQKSRKPTCALTQTRFFSKNGSEPKHHLCSWAI